MPDIGSAVGGFISLRGQNKASSAQDAASTSAERQAELAYQRTLPWDVEGSFGQATFDEAGRKLDMAMSGPWEEQYEDYLADAHAQEEFIGLYEGDPTEAAQKYYEMQKELMSPQQEKDRLALENRLLGQGMLGSTGGASQSEALHKAQAMQDLEARYTGIDKAQSMIDTYRGRKASSLGMAETIGQLPQKYAETGRGIGTGLSSIAGTAAELSGQAAQARGASQANKYLGYADQFKNLMQPTATPFSQGGYSGRVVQPGMFGGGAYVPTRMVGGVPVPR
jgi:hypothetical protein